jgi:HPt (histidine-containing phosphotransfer) domain-containing protein
LVCVNFVKTRQSWFDASRVASRSTSLSLGDSLLDWSRLDELREFDTPDGALVRETIASFVQQVPERLTEVTGSAGRRDARELYESAHALKGSATNIGAVAVGECAGRLEEAGKRGDLEDVARLTEELTTAVVRTLAALYAAPASDGEPEGA